MTEEQRKINDIFDIVLFLKDNAASKHDLAVLGGRVDTLETTLRSEMHEIKNELMGHIDGFIEMHKTVTAELAATRLKLGRVEDNVVMIGHTIELKLAPM